MPRLFRHILSGFAILAFLLLAAPPLRAQTTSASGAEAGAPGSIDAIRAARIVENLKYQIPQLRDQQVAVSSLREGTGPLDEGILLIGGQQQIEFVVTKDDKQLYLLAAKPIDVSKTTDQIAAMRADELEAERQRSRARHQRLLGASGDLPSRGNPDADVIIFEFSDFQCPYCAKAATTIEELLEKRGEEIKLVYLHLPLQIHPWAQPAAVAATCAAAQDPAAFWTLHDFYFQHQSDLTPENVLDRSEGALASTGVDIEAWTTCATDEDSATHKQALELIDGHLQIAREFAISGTPAFFVNGQYLNGVKPMSEFEAAIDSAEM